MAITDLPMLAALRTKMQWHQERQRVLAENISNSDTPNFKPRGKAKTCETWSKPVDVKRGDWIATFELGSTAVLITPPGLDVASLISPNQKVKYGQPVLTYGGSQG